MGKKLDEIQYTVQSLKSSVADTLVGGVNDAGRALVALEEQMQDLRVKMQETQTEFDLDLDTTAGNFTAGDSQADPFDQ